MGLFLGDSEPSKIFVGDTSISKVFLGDKQVRPKTRKPGANTMVYLPLNGDANDKSGNSHDGTLANNQGGYTWEYINGSSGNKCFRSYINAVSGYNKWGGSVSGNYSSTALGSGNRSISIWIKFVGPTNNGSPHWIGSSGGGTNGEWFGIYFGGGDFGILRYYDDPYMTTPSFGNTWHNIVITYSSTNLSNMYIDGVKQTLTGNPTSTFNTLGTGYQLGVLRTENTSQTTEYYMSEYIIEDKERTTQEVADYYNLTKGNYGL